MNNEPLTTRDVCLILDLTESALRSVLRRPGAPRPPLHPTLRAFLWTRADIVRIAALIERKPAWDALDNSASQRRGRAGT